MTREQILQVVKRSMDEKKITVYRLAKLSGNNETTIRRVLRGENSPSIDLVVSLLDALGLELSIEDKQE